MDAEPMWPMASLWLGVLDEVAVLSYQRFEAEMQGGDEGLLCAVEA